MSSDGDCMISIWMLGDLPLSDSDEGVLFFSIGACSFRTPLRTFGSVWTFCELGSGSEWVSLCVVSSYPSEIRDSSCFSGVVCSFCSVCT